MLAFFKSLVGQEPSPQRLVLQNREPTPEPLDPEEAARLREEKNKQQAEDRARRAAAAEKRVANTQRKKTANVNGTTAGENAAPKKKETALEQMARENKGWRDADAQADLRAWN